MQMVRKREKERSVKQNYMWIIMWIQFVISVLYRRKNNKSRKSMKASKIRNINNNKFKYITNFTILYKKIL